MADDILCGLNGVPITCEVLSKALQGLDGPDAAAVTSVEIVPGTENRFPTSHSCCAEMLARGRVSSRSVRQKGVVPIETWRCSDRKRGW
eukprot:878049-Rhodomonas_salina.2